MPVVFWLAHEYGGVKLKLVLLDFVQIVVDAVPHFAVMVCVRLEDWLVTFKVCAVPRVPFARVNEDFLEMVVSVLDADAEIVPLLTPVTNRAEAESVLVPSELWLTVTVLDITICDPLVVSPVLKVIFENEYVLPSTEIEPVHCPVALYEP